MYPTISFLCVSKCYNNISMKKTISICSLIIAVMVVTSVAPLVSAQPYGKGLYNEDVPYGNQTSLSIATSGNLTVPVTPTVSGTLATGNNTVTVTTTDVKGYKLYIRALSSTTMVNYTGTLPASGNGTLNPLVINTWGYNTDASSNFVGMSLSDVLIRTTNSPRKSGEATVVKYGMYLDFVKPAGNYSTDIVYTAAPQTD
jgi:hypothetical protein